MLFVTIPAYLAPIPIKTSAHKTKFRLLVGPAKKTLNSSHLRDLISMVRRRRPKGALPFAITLTQLMEERGLGLKQISELAQSPRTVVQGWLNGHAPHDLQAVSRLSKALGVGFKRLLLGEEELPLRVADLSMNFDEIEVFEGLCKVSVKRLVDKGNKK